MMDYRFLIAVVATIAIIGPFVAGAQPAQKTEPVKKSETAQKKKKKKITPPPAPVVIEPAPVQTEPPAMVQPNRPPWARPGECFRDEGSGRFVPCYPP